MNFDANLLAETETKSVGETITETETLAETGTETGTDTETTTETVVETTQSLSDSLSDSLPIMGMGMLGIFAVTAVIILSVVILNSISKHFDKKKKDDSDQ